MSTASFWLLSSPFLSAAVLCGVCLVSAPVAAQTPLGTPSSTPIQVDSSGRARIPDDKFRLDINVGVKGGMTGAWVFDVPAPAQSEYDRISQESKAYYPAFGLGGDIGLVLDVRALGIVGIETGARFSFDNAEGYNDIKQAGSNDVLFRVTQDQSTTSLRIPLLLKLSTPDGVVRPTFAAGIEFVNQLDSAISYDVENRGGVESSSSSTRREERNQIETSSYKLVSVALGLEIDLGHVKIPIELRGQYNLDYEGENFDNRVRVEDPDPNRRNDETFFYDGAYQGHFGISIGLIYDLVLLL